MRMRKKKHGAERIEACSELLIKDIGSCRYFFKIIPEHTLFDRNGNRGESSDCDVESKLQHISVYLLIKSG